MSATCPKFVPVIRVSVRWTFTRRMAISANRIKAIVSTESVQRWIISADSFGATVILNLKYIFYLKLI